MALKKEQEPEPREQRAAAKKINVAFGSNEVRLTGRQWLTAAILLALTLRLVPVLWRAAEKFETGPDYRIPYELSEDYWLFDRWCRKAAASGDRILVLGDSVVWSQYVKKENALSRQLSVLSGLKDKDGDGGGRFVNLGVDGMHPLSLEGLVASYGQALSGRRVILHCNPLWMSSPARDLRDTGEEIVRFNHPKLVSQFPPDVPGYDEGASSRIGIALERRLEILSWATHLRLAYFDGSDLPSWTLERPHDSLLDALTPLEAPAPEDNLRRRPVPWTRGGIRKQNWPWVDLETSPQWAAFRRTIDILQGRKNQVFVVVGPLNEHMLEEDSLERYKNLRAGITRHLTERGIPHFAPDVLPSELYADASHPLTEGYALLARSILENPAFKKFEGIRD